jgi:purine-binding chemotaxis protein CheW
VTAVPPPGEPSPPASAERRAASSRGDRDPERRRALLEARARAIAEAREAPRTEGIPVLAFRLEGRALAVEVADVGQVLEARGIWPLPASPPWLIGALVARTRIVPVLDLRPLLGLRAEAGSLRRVVVIERGGEAWAFGVQRLDGRRDVSADQVVAAEGPYKWATADGLSVLDLDALEGPAGRAG